MTEPAHSARSDSDSAAFYNFPPHMFPIKFELIGWGDEVLWEETITTAAALSVPGFPGKVKTCRVTYGNGEVAEA